MVDMANRLQLNDGDDGEVVLTGELDVATGPLLDARLESCADADTVTIDLVGVTFIDSSGLRVLIEHHQRLQDGGGELRLVRVSEPVARLLEIAGLSHHLNVTD